MQGEVKSVKWCKEHQSQVKWRDARWSETKWSDVKSSSSWNNQYNPQFTWQWLMVMKNTKQNCSKHITTRHKTFNMRQLLKPKLNDSGTWVTYVSGEEMNELLGMTDQAQAQSFPSKPVSMVNGVHVAIWEIAVAKGINNGVTRKDTHTTTYHTTGKRKRNNFSRNNFVHKDTVRNVNRFCWLHWVQVLGRAE